MPSSDIWGLEPRTSPSVVRRAPRDFAPALPAEYEERQSGGNWHIWAIPLVLSLGGIFMIASLTARSVQAEGVPFYWLALRQFQFLLLGLVLMYFSCLVPLSLLRKMKMSWSFWGLAFLLTVLAAIPGIGVRVGGARRWLSVAGIQFQPLELLTLAVPLLMAGLLVSSKREGFRCVCSPTLLIAALSSIPLYFQPNMGGIVIVFLICMSMHVENRGWTYPSLGAMIPLSLLALMVFSAEYRMRRFLAFWNPWDDPGGKGFQIIQGLVAFSNGGVFGVGIGKGLQKMNYLPAAHTDYIFPAIGEELGLIGTLIIVSLYALWTYKVYALYKRSDDPYISVLIWGLTASILFPMFINLGGVMKLMPLTGVPLPFISFGGTSLVAMWIKVGILMRIAKEAKRT